MAVPYCNLRSLNPGAQKAYGSAISDSGSVLNGCLQRTGVVFGLKVQQTAPGNYLNILNPYGESLHNPFSDYRFPKVLVRALYHQAPGQSNLSGLSNKTKAQQSDENILYTSQSGLRIDHVWSMAVKANSQSHSINANHFPLEATLQDTAGNGSSGVGRSIPKISNPSQKAYKQSEKRLASRKAYEQSCKGRASRKAYRQSVKGKAASKAYEQSDKGIAARKAYDKSDKGIAARKAYRQSDKGIAVSKAYEQSDNRRAARKAYRQSDKGIATRKAYEQSNKGIAARKAYEQSEKRKAARKAYLQSDEWKAYQKAYQKVLRNTGDKEQAKIAAKQASASIRKLKEAKKSELE